MDLGRLHVDLATIRAQYRYPDGVLELQVRLPNDIPARERTDRWGPGVLLAHPGHRATRLPGPTAAEEVHRVLSRVSDAQLPEARP